MLDTAKHPQGTFKSKSILQKGVNAFRHHRRPDAAWHHETGAGAADVQRHRHHTMGAAAGFSGTLTLNLSDFQVPFTREFEPGKRVVATSSRWSCRSRPSPSTCRLPSTGTLSGHMVDPQTIEGLLEGPSTRTSTARPTSCPANSTTSSLRSDSRRGAWRALSSSRTTSVPRPRHAGQSDRARGAGLRRHRVEQLRRRLESARPGHRRATGTRVCWLPSVDNANELEAIAVSATRPSCPTG